MQLIYSLQMGGSEKVAFDISSNLNRDMFQPHVCALDVDGALAAELAAGNIPHHVLYRKGVELGVFRRLYRLFRANRIDVVHTHHFTQLFYSALPARLAGARIVHTEHEFFSYMTSGVQRAFIRPASHLCDQFTVVGPEVSNYFVRTIGIPADRIVVVPNGVNVNALTYDRDTARRELGIGPAAVTIGTIGRLEPEKDQATLLEVIRRIRARHVGAQLIIAGDGSCAQALQTAASSLGVADATLFLGYRRDIARILAAIDVFVLPSIREGLPIALIEAMAARKPVVASAIGSVGDLVRDGENGLLAPAGDARAFSDAVHRLLESSALRTKLGQAARRTVESSFSLAAVVKTYENIYQAAVTNKHVRN